MFEKMPGDPHLPPGVTHRDLEPEPCKPGRCPACGSFKTRHARMTDGGHWDCEECGYDWEDE